MNFVQYGGIQQHGQLLNGWMQYGVLGDEIEDGGGRVAKKRAARAARDDRDMTDILTMIAGSIR